MDTYDMNEQQVQQPQQPQQVQQPQQPQQPQYTNPQPYAYPWQSAQGYYTYQQPVYTPPIPTPEKPKKVGVWKTVLISAMVSALCCSLTAVGITAYWQSRNNNLTASFNEKLAVLRQEIEDKSYIGAGDSVSGTPGTAVEGGLTPAQVYAKNVDSVVAIECTVEDEYFGEYYEGITSGSGFVMTEDGYIISNYHVVADSLSITVIFNDGTEYEATFVGGDEANDIALLKVEAEGLKPAQIGSSDALIVGDQVAAIGNPLGELASTLTVGYISAKDRIVTTEGAQINMLQTDAAINPGNSGGPLFNMKGQVIGITSAKYSGLTDSGATIEGIGFAIPMDDVIDMLEDLRDLGYITGPYLGVGVSNVDSYVSQFYGLPMGALVQTVTPGSCAQKAGIQKQDIIVNVGGYDVENINDLGRALRKFDAGDKVTITVYRSGNQVQLSVTLDEKPQQ